MTLDPAARAAAAAGRPPPLGAVGRVRLSLRIGMLVAAAAVAIPLHYAWAAAGRRSPWPRRFLRVAARLCGARVTVVGTARRRDVFYIANHVSWIDIPAIAGASGTAFVAKAEIRASPVVGWLSTLNRTVFVEREDKLGVSAQIDRLRAALRDWSVTVFPEGTTTDGRSLFPFRTPMLKVLEPPPAGVLVQPVLVDYGAAGEEIAWIGAESGRANAARLLARAGTIAVSVHFLEPFDPHHVPGRKAIAAESRRRIEAALVAAMGAPLRVFTGHAQP